ncbi:hypothetical protein [Hydrogenovibrio marinus]|uniref:Lipoprotein n=1 Tax=Hydrogenovibrio marinus TaxID=28885 RepID=A0A067A1Y8_HYDMR|nr:hypothetical protein [Hydrogenovibrio marinus]KDN96380.1 hypothetical protein EI16_08895 [Hydrogenovibrio marinus]BBN60426.1 hypothetical protein HVMH_2020 [Hydrogenovibrio marinus]
MPFNLTKRFFQSILTIIILSSLSACSSTPSTPSEGKMIVLHEKDNKQATDIIVKTMLDEGYETKKVNDTQFIVFYDQQTFIMEPKMIQGGLSRIVVNRVVKIKPKYRHSPELQAMTTVLNRKLNFAKFSLIDHNKAGQIQASITFINETVSTEEIRQFMLWLDDSLASVRSMVAPEVLQMIDSPNAVSVQKP